MDKELEYIDGFIAENEYNIKNLKNTGYSIERQKQYSEYLFKRREMLDFIRQTLMTISKKEKAFDVIKKYAVNDGWSNGWVVKFWDMDNEELELVNEVLLNE